MAMYTTIVDAPFGRMSISSSKPMAIFINDTYMGVTGNDDGFAHDSPLETSTTAPRWALQRINHPSNRHRQPAEYPSLVASPPCSGSFHNRKRRSASADDESCLKKQKTQPQVVDPQTPGPSRAPALHDQPPHASVASGTASGTLDGSVGPHGSLMPVYETCDEVHRKINDHHLTPGLTQAKFCRDLFAMLSGTKFTGLQAKQLNDFRNKKGPRAGCSFSVFYAAYVFFEKARIAESRPKSQHCLDMECIWESRGRFELKHDGRHGTNTTPGKSIEMDQYGRT